MIAKKKTCKRSGQPYVAYRNQWEEQIMDDREQKIRRRAHQLWLDAGEPDGQEAEHWEQAIAEMDGEAAVAKKSAAQLLEEAAAPEKETADLPDDVVRRKKR